MGEVRARDSLALPTVRKVTDTPGAARNRNSAVSTGPQRKRSQKPGLPGRPGARVFDSRKVMKAQVEDPGWRVLYLALTYRYELPSDLLRRLRASIGDGERRDGVRLRGLRESQARAAWSLLRRCGRAIVRRA